MKRAMLVVAVLAACKTQGAITLSVASCGGTKRAVYAEPGTGCGDCVCGACFGAHDGGRFVCGADVSCGDGEIDFDLSPGPWAIVIESLDVNDRVVATACEDVVVDADGFSDRTGQTTECSACN